MASVAAVKSRDDTSEASLHVLHVADYDFFDRFGRMFRHLVLAQDAEGLRVALLTDDPVAVADMEGTPIECHWVAALSGWRSWQPLRQFTRRPGPRPDAVHVWSTARLDGIGPWALRVGVPVVAHVLAGADVETVVRRRWREHIYVAAACEGLRQRLGAYRFRRGTAARLLSPALLMPEAAPAEASVEGHTLGVLWAGRMTSDAGLETLVEAVATLRRKQQDVQVVLIGAGPEGGSVRARIKAQGLQDCVSLVEEPDLWDQALAGADVCVVPACQEELLLTPLVAMALGKIVIASRDQLAEWFVEDRTAWQFTPGRAVELAYHLARAAERDQHAEDLRQSALAYVKEHHSIGRLVSGSLEMYADAAAAHRS
jgi:glycosyltransferase involved in cell wall biosynthesis